MVKKNEPKRCSWQNFTKEVNKRRRLQTFMERRRGFEEEIKRGDEVVKNIRGGGGCGGKTEGKRRRSGEGGD